MGRNKFYVLSCGFALFTLILAFSLMTYEISSTAQLSPIKCSVASTTVERALQIHPFLTNKANFQKNQMNVSYLLLREYELMDTWSGGKNKAKTKPIQTQYKANTNPIYPVVASGEAGTNPISEENNAIFDN